MGDANKVLGIDKGDITHVSEVESSSISEMMSVGISFTVVPIGLIIPFNDTSIPSGWERFTSADNRHIVGAGNTYSVGDTGGSTTLNINAQSSSAGTHSLDTGNWFGARENFSTGSQPQLHSQIKGGP